MTRHLANLDLVHVVIAAQQQQPDLALDHGTGTVELVRGEHSDFTVVSSGALNSAATSAQVLLPGVGVSCIV